MRHYEIVFLVHPDQSEQVPGMVERYKSIVENSGGTVHRLEDWGRRQLAYMINKIHKAHYIMMNIECNAQARDEIENIFKYNDAILRSLILKRNRAITASSPLFEEADDTAAKKEKPSLASNTAKPAPVEDGQAVEKKTNLAKTTNKSEVIA